MLRRRYHAQAQTARETKRKKAAHEARRPRRHSTRSVLGRTQGRVFVRRIGICLFASAPNQLPLSAFFACYFFFHFRAEAATPKLHANAIAERHLIRALHKVARSVVTNCVASLEKAQRAALFQ